MGALESCGCNCGSITKADPEEVHKAKREGKGKTGGRKDKGNDDRQEKKSPRWGMSSSSQGGDSSTRTYSFMGDNSSMSPPAAAALGAKSTGENDEECEGGEEYEGEEYYEDEEEYYEEAEEGEYYDEGENYEEGDDAGYGDADEEAYDEAYAEEDEEAYADENEEPNEPPEKAKEQVFTAPPAPAKPNPDDLPVDPDVTEGVYLCYEEVASGTIRLVHSKTYVKGALVYAKPTVEIQPFKFKGEARRTVLLRGAQTDRRQFYTAWCSFMKQAKTYEAKVLLLPHYDSVQKISVSFVKSNNEVHHLTYDEWLDVTQFVACLACPSRETIVGEVKTMDIRMFIEKGGSSSQLSASLAL